MRRFPRMRRFAALGAVLALTAVVVPDSGVRSPDVSLVKIEGASGIDSPDRVVWVLALGSDARPGQQIDRQRADAIQLIGLNFRTGDGVIFGIPRDSYVAIPGYGSSRVNAAMVFGGPELMAETVGNMFGIDIDYAFVASFWGFTNLVRSIGGVTVNSDYAFDDPNLTGSYRAGRNRVNGYDATHFGRMRYNVRGGDFGRSANQSELVKGIARKVATRLDSPGFIEGGLVGVVRHLDTNLSPREVFRLGHAATQIDPRKLRSCVLQGSFANIGGASVINPDLATARRWADDTRGDARLDNGC